jgi:prevent-host-death family protein
MKVFDVSKLRRSIAAIVDSVRDGSVVVIRRYGRPCAAIVPISRLTNAEQTAVRTGKRPPG